MTDRMALAAEATMTELQAEMGRVRKLASDLRRTQGRVEELKILARRTNELLGGQKRRQARARLHALIATATRTYSKAEESRAAAVDAYLAEHQGEEITPKELEKALHAQDHAIPDRRYAARTLARKAAQGVLKRVRRGQYLFENEQPKTSQPPLPG